MVKWLLFVALSLMALPGPDHRANAGKSCVQCHDDTLALVPRDHKMGWQKEHGKEALVKKQECALCHAERECNRCHGSGVQGAKKPHPVNYVAVHGRDARMGKERCLTCHRGGESCNQCHRERKIMPRSHQRAGFVNASNGGTHAKEARWNISNCQSCHGSGRKEPTCAACHGKMDAKTGASVTR